MEEYNKNKNTIGKVLRRTSFGILLLLIISVVAGLWVTRPSVGLSTQSPEMVDLPDIINAQSGEIELNFSTPHEVIFGDTKIVGNTITLLPEDLEEGANNIQVRKLNDLYLFSVVSLTPDNYIVNKDSVLPQQVRVGSFDEYVLLDESIALNLSDVEVGGNVFIDGSQVNQNTDGTYTVSLEDGDNKLEITQIDEAGNVSIPTFIDIFAVNASVYSSAECEKVRFVYDTRDWQIGYQFDESIYQGQNETDADKAAIDDFISVSQNGRCDRLEDSSAVDLDNFYGGDVLQVMPAGTPLLCIACGTNFSRNLSLQIYRDDSQNETVASIIRSEQEDYTNPQGVEGTIVHYDREIELDGRVDVFGSSYFVFELKGEDVAIALQYRYEKERGINPDSLDEMTSGFELLRDTVELR